MKRHLLFAMLCIVGALNVSAQQEPESGSVYYVYNVETGKFLTRGNSWGTRAVANDFGSPWQVTIVNSKYELRMYDLVVGENTNGLSSNGFTDSEAAIQFSLEGNSEGYKLLNGSNYLTLDSGGTDYLVNVSGTNATGNTTWQFLNVDQYKAKLTAKTLTQEQAVASAAGLNLAINAVGDLANELQNWTSFDKTSNINNPGITSATGWTVSDIPNRGGNKNYGSYGAECFQGGGSYSQTISGLAPGIYKVGVKAMFRALGNGQCVTIGNAGYVNSSAYLKANGNTVQIKDWYSDRASDSNPNSTGEFTTLANNGKYLSEVFAYVGNDGNLTITAVSESFWWGSWLILGGFNLTQYIQQVSQEEINALIAEVEQYESAAVPAAVLADMATAKAALQSEPSLENYQALSDALGVVKNWINALASAKEYLDRMAETLDNTNFYTAQSYEEQYGQWKTKYEAGTLTYDEAAALTADAAWNGGWHTANKIDDVLLSCWTIGGQQCENYERGLYINTWSVEGNNDGSNFRVPFFEYWNDDNNSLGANTLQATMTGLTPNQAYKVTLWARLRAKNNGSITDGSITMQVGEGTSVSLTTGSQIGTSQLYIGEFYATGKADSDGNLTLKLNVAEGSNVSWLAFKNAKYEEIDNECAPYAEELAELIAQAQSLENSLPTGVKNTLENIVDQYDEYTSNNNTVTQFQEAIAAVKEAIANAQPVVAPYTAYLELKPYADALVAVTNDNAEANSALATAISNAETNIAAVTNAVEAADVNTTLRTAMDTYVAAATPVGSDAQFDLTYMFTNPDVTNFPSWKPAPDGWHSDQTNGNFQVMNRGDVDSEEDNTKTKFVEYWNYNAMNNGEFNLYQQVTLPEGTYNMSCYAFARQQDGETDKEPKVGVFIYANDTQGSAIDNPRLEYKEVEFVNTEGQDVKIGLKAIDPNTYNWMGIGYLHLYKLPKTFEISETKEWDATIAGVGNVTLTRAISDTNINTLVLPFSMTADEVATYFGEGSKVYVVGSYANDNIVLSAKTSEDETWISANEPVLLKATKASEAGTSYEIPARTIVATETDPKAQVEGLDFVGVYEFTEGYTHTDGKGRFVVPVGSYIVSNNKFRHVENDGTAVLKSTRAYFTLTDNSGSGIKALTLSFDDSEATGIATVEDGQLNILTGKVYDLSGREVKNPAKGLYIIDGKKVMIK